MDKLKTINFKGQEYFDDRMFILYLCKGKVDIAPDGEGIVTTIIYHDEAPSDFLWCIVTYRNCFRYPVFRVDSFYKKEDAMTYLRKIEPETPRISLKGKSPDTVVSFEEFQNWKIKNNLKEYNWKEMFVGTPSCGHAEEHMMELKENFEGIK